MSKTMRDAYDKFIRGEKLTENEQQDVSIVVGMLGLAGLSDREEKKTNAK